MGLNLMNVCCNSCCCGGPTWPLGKLLRPTNHCSLRSRLPQFRNLRISKILSPSNRHPQAMKGWTSILNLPSDVSWRNLPSTIRFPNGEERPIKPKIWKQVLFEAAEWLISNGGLTKDGCPIGQDSNRYIVHTEPMQLSGKAFFFPAQLSNGLFIASASNAKKAADDCAYLNEILWPRPVESPTRAQLRAALVVRQAIEIIGKEKDPFPPARSVHATISRNL